MKQARSLLFSLALIVTTAVFCLIGLPFLVLPRRLGRPLQKSWTVTISHLARLICGIDYEVRGAEHIPHGAAIVASKHQSAWETLSFVHILPDPSFVLKKELTRIPLFGWFTIKFGNLPLDRSGGGKALRMLLISAREVAAAHRQIVIFPEGTRRDPGATPDYHRGVIALYRALNVPCVPVALNSGHYWPAHGGRRRPGRIVVEFLPPIPPGLGGDAFLAALTERIEPASALLLEEAKAKTGG
ncbi:MAG: 1-acyl-sn-glycerol-3-phosphate acyltransferase [Rhizobiales bacterium]|nr:1-acyl-sn-glycerol-3-phosphate acyltransferase [Hyphomicrobiales bacterium]